MQTVGAYEAKTNFAALLDRVEKGETITITRRGVPVAVLIPAQAKPRMTPQQAAEELLAMRAELAARGVKFTTQEIKEMIHEGHKY